MPCNHFSSIRVRYRFKTLAQMSRLRHYKPSSTSPISTYLQISRQVPSAARILHQLEPQYVLDSPSTRWFLVGRVLRNCSHCWLTVLEIDAWDNDDDPEEPKVTHGYTLVSRISFRSVCETIRDFFDKQVAELPNRRVIRLHRFFCLSRITAVLTASCALFKL